ncbi:hypothetical protein A1O1_05696 [Capronia coronata CBS 617.96]|uniref:Phytanoyl-CoA dioxygenase n=1 Tax=Capronia coronata CBS 617.96 TaxID=1182541 RepID=W9XXV4_9EURO|nr:uncharacterized protein A1O1_05696 [Capronia coronata CBS 617.96]EXJ85332.1 hypothetical protein A1O1_05696 [Capronia coronata CBS 617.96]
MGSMMETPKVPVFDARSVTPEEVVQGLIHAGGAVIRNAMDVEDVHQIEKDIRPWLEKDKPWKEGGFFPVETRRAYGLAGKSKTFIEKMVKQETFQKVCDIILSKTSPAWVGQKREVSTSKPQLNTTIAFSIGPGAHRQELHRDDMIHHNYPLKGITASEFTFDREVGIGWFVAGKKTTRANGATRFIPGSHLWDSELPPDESQAFYAELEPGDGFVMLSSCFHAGSANTTTDEERLLYCCFMTKGYLRQEENQYLASDPQVLKQMYDKETLKLIGYNLSAPFLGWVNQLPPLKVLFGAELEEAEDLF